MSCLNNRRMMDIEHVRKLAKVFSDNEKKTVFIFKTNRSGIGEVYDFTIIPVENAVETINYISNDNSKNFLLNSGKGKSTGIGKSKSVDATKEVVSDIGGILPEDGSNEVPTISDTNAQESAIGE